MTEEEAQFFMPNLKAYEAKLALFDGNEDIAKEWLDHYFVTDMEHVELFRVFQHFTTARAYIALGEREEAARYLQLLKEYGQNLNRPLDAAEAGVLLSVLFYAIGKKKEAVSELLSVLELMQPYGFVRVIADEGASILPVLKRVASYVSSADYKGALSQKYLNDILLAAHAAAKQYKGVTANFTCTDKPVKLSKQQVRMVELLSQGYRNAQIAEITGLAIPTIKTHTSLAYQKLGVNNALDAVLRAKELGIIQ